MISPEDAAALLLTRKKRAGRRYRPKQKPIDPVEPLKALSPRQKQVLLRILAGHELKEIATQLRVDYRTASDHRCAALRKLGLATTIDLVRFAIRHGLLEA